MRIGRWGPREPPHAARSAAAVLELFDQDELDEAKTLAERLHTEDVYLQMEVASDLGVSSLLDGELPSMHFCDFLRYTSGIRGKEWKLVNQEVA